MTSTTGLVCLALVLGCARRGEVTPPPAPDEARPEATAAPAADASSRDWSRSLDPETLGAPWVEDHRACRAEAGRIGYATGAFELVDTRDEGAHRFLYFLDRSDEETSGNHFGCRVDAGDGDILILHEG